MDSSNKSSGGFKITCPLGVVMCGLVNGMSTLSCGVLYFSDKTSIEPSSKTDDPIFRVGYVVHLLGVIYWI